MPPPIRALSSQNRGAVRSDLLPPRRKSFVGGYCAAGALGSAAAPDNRPPWGVSRPPLIGGFYALTTHLYSRPRCRHGRAPLWPSLRSLLLSVLDFPFARRFALRPVRHARAQGRAPPLGALPVPTATQTPCRQGLQNPLTPRRGVLFCKPANLASRTLSDAKRIRISRA